MTTPKRTAADVLRTLFHSYNPRNQTLPINDARRALCSDLLALLPKPSRDISDARRIGHNQAIDQMEAAINSYFEVKE